MNEIQSITFRLGDALPKKVIEGWKTELEESRTKEEEYQLELRRRIARYEDAGHGSCLLRDPRCAEIVQGALLYFDSERYRVLEWCIMPNHIHALIKVSEGYRTGDIVRSWKRFSARELNKLHHREGPFWAVDYYDRYIRDEKHLADVRSYIRRNPVAAGLCKEPEDWRWGSAWGGM